MYKMKIELILGITGTITGTVATVLTIANRVTSIRNRNNDLRIRFLTTLSNTKSICDNFDGLSSKAEHSFDARSAANGNLYGGSHIKRKTEINEDRQSVCSISKELNVLLKRAEETGAYVDLIIQIDQLEKRANSLKSKYDKWLQDDKENVVRTSK